MNKYVKMLGLAAVAAVALMAFAGPASATILTSPAGTTHTSTWEKTSSNWKLHGAFVTVECSHSVFKGSVSNHGGAQVHVTWSSMTMTGCNYQTTVLKTGSLTINGSNVEQSTGTEVTIHTSVGTCIFTTNGTVVGTLTEGTPATTDINSAKIPRTGGNFLCGSSGTMTGSYTTTNPKTLLVD